VLTETWSESYTKLLIFNLTQYDRVLHLDSDSTILEPMDELFLLPPSPVVMPRAYWFDDDRRELFTTGLMLVQPSKTGFSRIMRTAKEARKEEYDMEIMNNIYGDTAEVLPHRPYILVSGEFRAKSHDKYLRGDDGDDEEPVEEWDATDVFNEAKFVHFSDWPVAKPWRYNSPMFKRLHEPKCGKLLHQVDCSGKEIWNWLYDDFAARRKVSRPCANADAFMRLCVYADPCSRFVVLIW
jgi:alpha-N-acetylglucosamine transferase